MHIVGKPGTPRKGKWLNRGDVVLSKESRKLAFHLEESAEDKRKELSERKRLGF